MSRVTWLVALALVVAGCSGTTSPEDGVTESTSRRSFAVDFAVSAQRALEGTPYETLGPEGVTDLVMELCDGLGMGAIPAAIDSVGFGGLGSDGDILAEVLRVGVTQVCPDRASADLTAIYLDSVRSAVRAAGALSAFDEQAAVGAAATVCTSLASDGGPESALLGVVTALYGQTADSVAELSVAIDSEQGLVAGAVLASATALLCPDRFGDVTEYVRSL